MALEQKLRLRLAQRLVMTPSLQQAIKLLQLSRLELEDAITQEMLENPMLDVEQEDLDDDEPSSLEEGQQSEVTEAGERAAEELTPTTETEEILPSPEESYQDIDFEAFFSDYLPDSRTEGRSMAFNTEDETPLENVLTAPPALYDHLMWQLNLVEFPERLRPACEFIIGNLDEDGFLRVSDEEILQAAGLESEDDVALALGIVRSLDPPGVAARSLQECLLYQLGLLKHNEEVALERHLAERLELVIRDHWEDLLKQKWEKLAQTLECEIAELKPLLEVLHRLEPKPGRAYHHDDNYVVEPDVYVHKVSGEYMITLNDDGLPRLRVNSHYLSMLKGKQVDTETASFLRDKMRSAVWLIKSIDQRQRTIYRVADSIVRFQRDFLDHGLEFLKPMVLRQVAEDVGLHESTVSRVVSNKYIYTPRGLFPMKFFFHSGVDSARGENVSSLVVKERIRKLIEEEDQEKPLSDSKIMKLLQREGIRLARRTVAKYREELGIPSSDKRKRLF